MSDESIQIGDWEFLPASAELRRGAERRALEDRAARVLAILARSRGEVVGHEQLLAEVWRGRTVSSNSLAVVIGDLRRALDDNARSPKHIETVAKRGYRLTAPGAVRHAAPARRPVVIGAVLLALVAVVGLASLLGVASQRPSIAVADIANETGDARHGPLARAVTEVVLAEATRGALRVQRSNEGDQTAIVMSGRLVMWSGHPSVSLSATDTRSGEVIWSGIAPGPEDSLPGQVSTLMDEFANAVEDRPPAT